MAGRLFLGTLGFHENFIVRTLHTFAAGRNDGLMLVTLKPIVKGVEIAMRNLDSLRLRLGVYSHGHIEVDPSSPLESIGQVYEAVLSIIKDKRYIELVADLSGGPRIVVVSTLLALLFASEKVPVRLLVQDETGSGGILDIRLTPIRQALRGMGIRGRILRIVSEKPGIGQEEIAGALGISEKTAANYISQLTRLGLVARRGRARNVYPTGLGRLVARLVE